MFFSCLRICRKLLLVPTMDEDECIELLSCQDDYYLNEIERVILEIFLFDCSSLSLLEVFQNERRRVNIQYPFIVRNTHIFTIESSNCVENIIGYYKNVLCCNEKYIHRVVKKFVHSAVSIQENDISSIVLHHLFEIVVVLFHWEFHPFYSLLKYPLEVKNRYKIELRS